MTNNGYIYIRCHYSYNDYNVYKLGESKDIISRDATYTTGEFIKGDLLLVLELYSHDSKIVEKLLKMYFKQYNIRNTGGTEFFDKYILDNIKTFLDTTIIKYKEVNINELKRKIRLNKFINDLTNIKHKYNLCFLKRKRNDDYKLQNELQQKYLDEIIPELKNNKRVLIKAPTGFGKTHLYYKIISKIQPKKILIFTPRKLLNQQMLEDKYSHYISNDNYKILHFSESTDKKKDIKHIIKKERIIITSCYQSNEKLYELITHYNFKFDLIIFDEAHFISNWINENLFLTDNITEYRIFGTATPPENYSEHNSIFGKIIEKVKIYELINNKILCDIETIVKKLDNKKEEYHNLKDLIVNSMKKYNKRKGIIYVNETANAEKLYNLMKQQTDIDTYIYVSKDIEVENENDKDIEQFELNIKPSVIIVVGKLGYGYDNPDIDLLCMGDLRQSDIDIRQIIGRGLRWNKKDYPNKLLHLLVPLYKNQFESYKDNSHLKKYLDYIIGECGHDLIFKENYNKIGKETTNINKDGKDYDGDNIPIEILKEYCTTGYNKFSDFERFLKTNNIIDEQSYNDLLDKQDWMPQLGNIHKKYPKFCFRNIDINKNNYYQTKEEAKNNYNDTIQILKKNIGIDKYSDLTHEQILKRINIINKKIPLVDIDLYYGII